MLTGDFKHNLFTAANQIPDKIVRRVYVCEI